MSRRTDVTPELVLRAYRAGMFPMAESRSSTVLHWLDPPQRGVLPLATFHLSKRLSRSVRNSPYLMLADHDFAGTLRGCAAPGPERAETWINPQIQRVFTELHIAGFAHSVEAWQDGVLVGGLYGIALGAAFFGESMFSLARDASKIALVHLVARLRLGGFRLLDTQFVTEHLSQFGAVEIPRARYKALLVDALAHPARFAANPPAAALAEVIARLRS